MWSLPCVTFLKSIELESCDRETKSIRLDFQGVNLAEAVTCLRSNQIKKVADGITCVIGSLGTITKSCFNDFNVVIFTFEDHATAALMLDRLKDDHQAILEAINNVWQKENDIAVKEILRFLFMTEDPNRPLLKDRPLIASLCEKCDKNKKIRTERVEHASSKGTKEERGHLHDLHRDDWYDDHERNGPGDWDISYGCGDEDYDRGMEMYWDM